MKKQYKNSQYIIYDDGRCYSLRMITEIFLPLVKDKNLINHIDGNTHNFNLTNLEWGDYKENVQHAFRTGLRQVGGQSKIEFKPLSGEE